MDLKFSFKDLTVEKGFKQKKDSFFKQREDISDEEINWDAQEEEQQNLNFITFDDYLQTVDSKWSQGKTKYEWN